MDSCCPDTCEFASTMECPRPCNTYLSNMDKLLKKDKNYGLSGIEDNSDINKLREKIDKDNMINVVEI